jgi:hypothetical protein
MTLSGVLQSSSKSRLCCSTGTLLPTFEDPQFFSHVCKQSPVAGKNFILQIPYFVVIGTLWCA